VSGATEYQVQWFFFRIDPMVFFGLFDEYELNYGKPDKIEKKALKYKKIIFGEIEKVSIEYC